jgi:hypothetical protein
MLLILVVIVTQNWVTIALLPTRMRPALGFLLQAAITVDGNRQPL